MICVRYRKNNSARLGDWEYLFLNDTFKGRIDDIDEYIDAYCIPDYLKDHNGYRGFDSEETTAPKEIVQKEIEKTQEKIENTMDYKAELEKYFEQLP